MFPLDLDKLTPEQRAMVDLWEAHLKAEFQDKDARASCDTMVARPYVNHVPVLTGGVGRRQLEHFYGRYFIPGMPADVELVPISRTVGQNRHRGRVRLPLHAHGSDGLAAARGAADGAAAGAGHGGGRLLRGRQDPPRTSTGTRPRPWCSWGCSTRRTSQWPESKALVRCSTRQPSRRTC
jgi:hypothetical protein